ncbi:hypothetical protein KCU87_g473, partial [Aureobasidium melanogenum]
MHAKTGENKPPKSTQLQTSKYMPNTSTPNRYPPLLSLSKQCLRVEVLGYCASGFGGEEERCGLRGKVLRHSAGQTIRARRCPSVSSSGSGASVSAFVPVMPPNVLRMSSEKAVDLRLSASATSPNAAFSICFCLRRRKRCPSGSSGSSSSFESSPGNGTASGAAGTPLRRKRRLLNGSLSSNSRFSIRPNGRSQSDSSFLPRLSRPFFVGYRTPSGTSSSSSSSASSAPGASHASLARPCFSFLFFSTCLTASI